MAPVLIFDRGTLVCTGPADQLVLGVEDPAKLSYRALLFFSALIQGAYLAHVDTHANAATLLKVPALCDLDSAQRLSHIAVEIDDLRLFQCCLTYQLQEQISRSRSADRAHHCCRDGRVSKHVIEQPRPLPYGARHLYSRIAPM